MPLIWLDAMKICVQYDRLRANAAICADRNRCPGDQFAAVDDNGASPDLNERIFVTWLQQDRYRLCPGHPETKYNVFFNNQAPFALKLDRVIELGRRCDFDAATMEHSLEEKEPFSPRG